MSPSFGSESAPQIGFSFCSSWGCFLTPAAMFFYARGHADSEIAPTFGSETEPDFGRIFCSSGLFLGYAGGPPLHPPGPRVLAGRSCSLDRALDLTQQEFVGTRCRALYLSMGLARRSGCTRGVGSKQFAMATCPCVLVAKLYELRHFLVYPSSIQVSLS